MKAKKTTNKKQQKKKIILTTLAVSAAGVLGYFGWQYIKRRKAGKGTDLDEILKANNTAMVSDAFNIPSTIVRPRVQPGSTKSSSSAKSDFPLKKGSKGELVKQLQEAIISKYGKSILPKYGADGDFGTETLNALKKLKLPTTIEQSTFNMLTGGAKVNNGNVGADLYNATVTKDFNTVMRLLAKMKNTEDYTAANEFFKNNRINGVRQTIVNGLLNTFTREEQKQKIKLEFLRIGLQFDGDKWSLSGLDGLPIITTEPTTVWLNAYDGIKVPARMVLGNEVSQRLDYTLFQNKGKHFLVNTRSVKYL